MRAKKTIRVLLVDDHHIVRKGIRSSLQEHPEISVVGEASNGKIAVEKASELSPDIILMDINMPEMSGSKATKIIQDRFPKIKIIALTVHDNQEYVKEILDSGAQGYLLKNTTPEQLVLAVKSVAEGGAFFSPSVSRLMLEHYKTEAKGSKKSAITPREKQVLAMLVDGNSNKEMAAHFNLGVRTIETHRAQLLKKTGARNSIELCRLAIEQKLI